MEVFLLPPWFLDTNGLVQTMPTKFCYFLELATKATMATKFCNFLEFEKDKKSSMLC